MHLFFLKETKKWHTFLLWLRNSKRAVSVFYYACACIYPCKTFDTIIFVFQNIAKTNAQRQKEWRERQKKNNLEEYWKKELDQVNAYKRKQNKTEFHVEHRNANRQWREAKRINNDNQTNHTPSESSKSTKIMSSQSLGKAMKRLKRVLPKSPSNHQYVVRTLAESMTIVEKEKVRVQAGLSQETVNKVKDFCRGDVSLFMPGKQDVLTIWDKNGKRQEQKRILTMTINEAYEICIWNFYEWANWKNYQQK